MVWVAISSSGDTEDGMGSYLVVREWVIRYPARYFGIPYSTGYDLVATDETKWLISYKIT